MLLHDFSRWNVSNISSYPSTNVNIIIDELLPFFLSKIHHLSPILERDIDEEELFMQELEEERERQMREVEEALFLEEYQNQA